MEFNNNDLWMEIDDNWEFENLMREKKQKTTTLYVCIEERPSRSTSGLGSLLVGINLEGRKLLTLLSNALSKE